MRKRIGWYVDFDNVERFKKIEVDGAILYHKILRYKAFGRNLNVLRVHFQSKDHKSARFINLFSTDLELCPEKPFRLYRSRFQLEFLFRDGKQHMGLTDGQIRSENGVHHHCNLSLLATNLLRLKDREVQVKTEERIISLDAWKRKNYNRLLLKRTIVAFGIEVEVNKNKEKLQELINFAVNSA